MSEFLQRMRRQVKELAALERDLRAPREEWSDWQRTTMSSSVVGLGTPVERLFLADYFLMTWTEWRGLYERYPRYFGRSPEAFPLQWHQTAYRCEHLAATLMEDRSLGSTLAAAWEDRTDRFEQPVRSDRDEQRDVMLLYRSMVRNYLRANAVTSSETDRVNVNGSWARCAHVVHRADALWKDVFLAAPAAIRGAVPWHLRHYRHAALVLSWLKDGPPSTLEEILPEHRTTIQDMESWLSTVRLPNESVQEVRRVVLRVGQAIAEIGYDYFVTDLTSKEFVGGNDSPLGSANVLLVPGEHQDRPSGIVVGVTKGKWGRARLGFTRVMDQIKLS
jgi:hypothetical protein